MKTYVEFTNTSVFVVCCHNNMYSAQLKCFFKNDLTKLCCQHFYIYNISIAVPACVYCRQQNNRQAAINSLVLRECRPHNFDHRKAPDIIRIINNYIISNVQQVYIPLKLKLAVYFYTLVIQKAAAQTINQKQKFAVSSKKCS